MRKKFSRRGFLKMTGAGLAGASLLAAGCGGGSASTGSSGGDMWKQYSGTTLNFVSENTSPTTAIAANLHTFKELTGIDVNVLQLELGALVQKVALDIGSGEGAYQVVYADPYQIMAPYHEALADLNEFNNDDNLPSVPKGLDDFIPTQLDAAGRFGNQKNLYALPYDCPTMIWMYRKDLFDKYGDQMKQDLGFDPTPSPEATWEQYYQIANWFNENQDEVPYGTGHQARQYDSLMCDFSNILWAYGGDYFNNDKVGNIGTTTPGPCTLDEPKSLEGAEFYKKLLDIAHPGSVSWDWNALDEAFRTGQIAMAPNWHEFAAVDQDPAESTIVGKIGYSPLPRGPARNANMWGGTGVGLEMILGIAIALLVHELIWGKNLVLSLLLLPMFMAPVIVGLLGRFLTDSSYGLYAYVLRELGIFDQDILGTASSALPAVILMDVWEWTPLIVLIVLAGLASVNQYVIEAAKVDGANYLERLRHIVAPSIAGVVIVALLVRSMDAIRYFDIITVTTNGGPGNTTKIIPIRLYETAFRFFDLGYAAAIGLGMLVFSILVATVFVRILESRGLAK